MASDTATVRRAADGLQATLVRHRRFVHQHPELAFAEHQTAEYIEAELDRLGISHRRVAGTGVVAVIGSGERCIGVRGDMDALPIGEASGRDGYRSVNEGLSHACGHDAHVAILLGLAEILQGEDLDGTVALYFQPAEEGPGGAAPRVAAGVLDDPAPQAVIALHVAAEYPVGTVIVRAGPSTASDDTVKITVRGVGGHAAYPYLSVDPIPVAAQIVLAVQQLITREIDPVQPVVCTFGSITGGTRHNIIAPHVRIEGTFRTLHQHNRDLLTKRIPAVVQGIAAAHRAEAEVEIEPGYGVGVNDSGLIDLIEAAASAVVPADRIIREPDPGLGAEDFYAFGATGVPVAMFNLGVANPAKGITGAHHSPEFDIDEDALADGLAVFAETVRRFLSLADDAPAADERELHTDQHGGDQ